MSRRQRWHNIVGTSSRITDGREKAIAAAVSAGAHLLAPFLTRESAANDLRRVLVMRLDRIGDVVMSLPALHDLRAALPTAHLTLAVGQWSADVARDAPVNEAVIWNAPWVGRADEGALSYRALWRKVRSESTAGYDLAIDLQGDVRAIWLMAAARAAVRVGYANTGSASLLSRVVPLDETVSWVEQNRRAIDVALGRGRVTERPPFRWIDAAGRVRGREELRERLRALGWNEDNKGPIIGMHPGAGRKIKEWPIERFRSLTELLVTEFDAWVVLSGSSSEAKLTREIRAAAPHRTIDLAGDTGLKSFAEMITAMDVFVSGDTSALHFACAADVPTVAIFGPSDPGRYFSGGPTGFGGTAPKVALSSADLYCRPCNLIRNPPVECAARPMPECLDHISVDRVLGTLRDMLRSRQNLR